MLCCVTLPYFTLHYIMSCHLISIISYHMSDTVEPLKETPDIIPPTFWPILTRFTLLGK